MKRILGLSLSLLLSACAGASQYQQECASKYDVFADVFACTKDKLYNDPRAGLQTDPADTSEIVVYGEYLNSQLRQHLINDAQAKDLFAKKITELKVQHEPAPLPIQPAMH